MKCFTLVAFASGRGSNFSALVNRIHIPGIHGRFSALISDRADAPALALARAAGIPTHVVSYQAGRKHAEAAILDLLSEYKPDLITLCGFMRILGPACIGRYARQILNIHPSLLPAFPGLHAQAKAIQYGVKISGCTVHWVDEGIDTGQIILQEAVPVLHGDTEETLSARILLREHVIYAEAIRLLSQSHVSKEDKSAQVLV